MESNHGSEKAKKKNRFSNRKRGSLYNRPRVVTCMDFEDEGFSLCILIVDFLVLRKGIKEEGDWEEIKLWEGIANPKSP